MTQKPTAAMVREQVRQALAEDVGDGDLTAELVPADAESRATVVARESAVLCGVAWFDAVFAELDARIQTEWSAADGDHVEPTQILCRLVGPSRAMLTGERTALNFLQTLSATATVAREYSDRVKDTGARVLDTRKTLPGFRLAQKYAVVCGGCDNHRKGLYDAMLVKENHIMAAGSIAAAVAAARQRHPGVLLEVEVEDLVQLRQALTAGVDRVLLDNFGVAELREAVAITCGRTELEASGGVTLDTVRELAATGVDFVSVGALTKDVRAIDLSMRFEVPGHAETPLR